MANGKEHAAATRSLGAVLSLASAGAMLAGYPLPAIGLAVGAVGGHIAPPDLDLPGITYCERRILRWNRVAGILWRWYWFLYSMLIPHRHWLSHLPGIGTAGRMLYLLWWLPAVWLYAGWPLLPLAVIALWAWLSWSAQDTAHLHLDDWRLH